MDGTKSPATKTRRRKKRSMIEIITEPEIVEEGSLASFKPEIEILECPAFKGFQVEFEGVGYWLVIRNYLSDEPDPDTYSPGDAYIFCMSFDLITKYDETVRILNRVKAFLKGEGFKQLFSEIKSPDFYLLLELGFLRSSRYRHLISCPL
jgi:hypothetical protein